jgi:hypothetical protein
MAAYWQTVSLRVIVRPPISTVTVLVRQFWPVVVPVPGLGLGLA